MPPLEVTDLIEEVRDGHVFLSLLEVLLGTTLVSRVVIMSDYNSVIRKKNKAEQIKRTEMSFQIITLEIILIHLGDC